MELAKKLARSNVDSLFPHARQGKKILAINPTCSYMLRKEYPELLGNEEARQVGQAPMDLCEYLFSLKQAGRFCRDFLSTPTTNAYHHQRQQPRPWMQTCFVLHALTSGQAVSIVSAGFTSRLPM